MFGGEPAESSDHVAQLALAAVAGQHTEETAGYRIQAELRRERGERLARLAAANERAGDQLRELFRIEQRLIQCLKALGNGFDLPFVAGKVEQGGCVSSR